MATSVNDFVGQNPNYVGQANTAIRTKPKKGSKNQSWLSSLISEVGGAGGATGGAAAGAALGSVVPGIGTLIGGIAGAGLGGFIGGAGGRAVENKVRDDEFRLGDSLKEGALSGAFGAAGSGFQAARGLKAVGGLGSLEALAQGSDDALTAGAKSILKGGKSAGARIASGGVEELNALQGAGRSISTNAMGIGQGAKAPGLENLGAGKSDKYFDTLKSLGIKPNAPEKVQRALEPIMNKTGKEIAEFYGSSAVKYAPEQLDTLYDDILTTLMDDPSINLSKQGWNNVGRQLELMKKGDNPAKLWEYQKKLGSSINFGKGADAKLVDREAVARVIREKTGSLLDDSVKEASAARSTYHNAKDVDNLLRVASKQADRSGLVSTIATSQPARGALAKSGRAVEGLGNIVSGTGPVRRIATGTAARGIGNNMFGLTTPVPVEEDTTLYGEQAMQAPTGLEDSFGGYGKQTQAPQQTYTLQDALGEAQSILGNDATPAQYLSYAKALQAQQQDSIDGGPDTTKTTAQQYGLAESGYGALQQLAGLIQENPNIVNKTATPGRKLPIIGGVISNQAGTGEYDAIGYNIADSILRLRTGAQANESEVKNLQTQIMPRAGDSQQTVQRKLQQIQQIFQSTLSRANGTSGLGSALQQQPY